MPLVAVTFAVTDEVRPTGTAIEGAIVRVFSTDGETFVTQGTTDADGELVLDLEDETTYWVRFFKPEYEFQTRRTIDVDDSEDSNTFDVRGTNLMVYPPSANEHLCRASGYVRGADWAPRAGARMVFSLTGEHRVLGGQVMIGGDIVTESDSEGWIEVELARDTSYDCVVHGLDDTILRVQVPDAAACSITDLIWPYIQVLEYGSEEVSVGVGEELEVTVTVTLSSGVTTPFDMDQQDKFLARSFVVLTAEDSSIVGWSWDTDDNLVLEGLAAGTTTITAEAHPNAEAPRTPEPDRDLATLTVTVTE